MGFFSRKQKPPRPRVVAHPTMSMNQGSSASVTSDSSSPDTTRGSIARVWSGNSIPTTPLTPFSPVHMPKVDLPKPPDQQLDPAGYLRSLNAVRERCMVLAAKAVENDLKHFDVDMSKFEDVVRFVAGIIKRDYDAPFTSIPSHGRHQHFCVGGRDRIAQLLSTFPEHVDNTEKCRRLIDLFLVSVLLDAGSGTQWSYRSNENGRTYRRSEGLAVASLEIFKSVGRLLSRYDAALIEVTRLQGGALTPPSLMQGLFSSSKNKFQVDKGGLRALTVEAVAQGLQSREGNQVAGLEGRTYVLVRLGAAMDENPEIFGQEGRPGNMLGEREPSAPPSRRLPDPSEH